MSTTHTEIEKVQSVVVRITHSIDAKKWADLRALYADAVDVDYTSLQGGEAQKQAADDLVGGWKKNLHHVKTQHLLGPIDVAITGATAHAECHVRARHAVDASLPDGSTWVVLGHYVLELAQRGDEWRITKMKLETIDQEGNRKLLEQAST